MVGGCGHLPRTLNFELMLSSVSFLAKLPFIDVESTRPEAVSSNRSWTKGSSLVATSCSKLACRESLFFSRKKA